MWLIIFFIFCLGIGSILLFYMYKEALAERVIYHELTFPDFPESFQQISLFFISDIHRRMISDYIIHEVKGKTDIVIIGGDLLEKGVPIEQVEKNIEKLKQLGPIFFVWGNNDYEIDYRLLDMVLLHYGVKILDNTAVAFESDEGERFILLGIDDLSKERDRLDLAVQDAGEEGFKVLVSHDPRIKVKIKEEYNISLVLSGHTHGGQIRIFGFGPYELGGIKKLGRLTAFVSNGYGTTGIPLRLGAKSETHLITLKGEKKIPL